MEFIDRLGAPPELIRIINKEAELCTSLKKVVFDAHIRGLNNDLGAFAPEDGIIFIDMGECITRNIWIKRGFTIISNAWLNLLVTAFHELTHAAQLEAEPELITLSALPQSYEDEANELALKAVLNWTKDNSIPKLNELGWVGDQIKHFLNLIYPKYPEIVLEELKLEGTDLAANALVRAQTSKEYQEEKEVEKLINHINEGIVGAKLDNNFYLTAYEAVGM